MDLLVPSSGLPDARAALRRMLPGATWLHGAVAFASQGGVAALQAVLDEAGRPPTIRMVVRGAPITEPQAVLALDRELGADVRVVLGEAATRFHPKLWLARTPKETWVLSGSGNLTAGGLGGNDEQFELLRMPHQAASLSGPPSGSNRAANAHLSRWRAFFDKGRPLGEALGSPAWLTWEQQLERRAQLQEEVRALDNALAAADPRRSSDTRTETSRRELALSATTERPTIEQWMRRWYPDEQVRAAVFGLLADAMHAAHDHRSSGWAACAVHWSGHDSRPRLVVLCGVSQVFVAHSERGVFFECPPEHQDARAFAAAMRAAEAPGATVEDWGEGDLRHPTIVIPADRAAAAADAGGREAVGAAIRWRSPKVEDGKAGHAAFHCPALVDAVRRATGRDLAQPDHSHAV